MRFEAASKEIYEQNASYYKSSDNLALLDAFLRSDHECVRVVEHKWKDAYVGANSLRKSIERYRYGGVKAFVRGGEIYLVKI